VTTKALKLLYKDLMESINVVINDRHTDSLEDMDMDVETSAPQTRPCFGSLIKTKSVTLAPQCMKNLISLKEVKYGILFQDQKDSMSLEPNGCSRMSLMKMGL
jgi:hypothetical protein